MLLIVCQLVSRKTYQKDLNGKLFGNGRKAEEAECGGGGWSRERIGVFLCLTKYFIKWYAKAALFPHETKEWRNWNRAGGNNRRFCARATSANLGEEFA